MIITSRNHQKFKQYANHQMIYNQMPYFFSIFRNQTGFIQKMEVILSCKFKLEECDYLYAAQIGINTGCTQAHVCIWQYCCYFVSVFRCHKYKLMNKARPTYTMSFHGPQTFNQSKQRKIIIDFERKIQQYFKDQQAKCFNLFSFKVWLKTRDIILAPNEKINNKPARSSREGR